MFRPFLHITIVLAFAFSFIIPSFKANASTLLGLPEPGTMVFLSSSYKPAMIKGLKVYPDNPLRFDFIVDAGEDLLDGIQLEQEGRKLIKYFLGSLAIPEKDLWVNLSPYEKDKIVPEALGQTDMGRDLLEQDYILKQITASLIYPEKELGKKFWDKVYGKAKKLYGTIQIPVNTFNKVWIVADRAEVFEAKDTAFVVDSHLKVMLEEDYLAMSKTSDPKNALSSQVIREIILPELEKEVNGGKNFAQLRQIFHSMILANWYKNNLKQTLLNQVYADQGKVKGIDLQDPSVKGKIYQQYLKAYKKGVFNFIKEEAYGADGQRIPRKYFSGGMQPGAAAHPQRTQNILKLDSAMSSVHGLKVFRVDLNLKKTKLETDPAMSAGNSANYLKTVMQYTYSKTQENLPIFRISHVVTLTVKPEEEKSIMDAVASRKDIVLLTRETLKALIGRNENLNIFLDESAGLIPEQHKGFYAVLSSNIIEILDSSKINISPNLLFPGDLLQIDKNFKPEVIPEDILNTPKIIVRAGVFFRIKVHDRANDRYLYLLLFNQRNLQKKIILEKDLNALGLNTARLWGDLLLKGYINRKGKLSPNFLALTHASQMVLAEEFHSKRQKIFDLLRQSYGRRITPVGGGIQFGEGGQELYTRHLGPMELIEGEDPSDIRRIIPGRALPEFVKLFLSGEGQEENPIKRELEEELNGETGIFSELPLEWTELENVNRLEPAAADRAVLSQTPGGIDLDAGKMKMNIHKNLQGISPSFNSIDIELIRQNGFDFLEFNIQSIFPITNLSI